VPGALVNAVSDALGAPITTEQTPMVSANGAAVGEIPPSSDFFRLGAYGFTVLSYGLPTPSGGHCPAGGRDVDLRSHRVGADLGGGLIPRGDEIRSNTFVALPMSPDLAQAYLPSLTHLSQR